ncbi:MAG TPA: MarR family transcriptional regulator [Candidatus Acidoferrales bacterium]|nr:MarR family transcriptional regulator [Candidatus Acidoferrales bacterium]
MNFQSGEGPGEGPEGDVVERVLRLQPLLEKTLRVPLPDEVNSRLGAVTPHQLEALGRLPREGITMHEFADAVGISGAAATALANRMIRQGLAQRSYDASDRRTVWLAPTTQGLETARAVQEWRRRSVVKMLERLDPAQVTVFLEVLSALALPPQNQESATSDSPRASD